MDNFIGKLESVFNLTNDPVLGIFNDKIVFCNPAANEIFGKEIANEPAANHLPSHVLSQNDESFSLNIDIGNKTYKVSGGMIDFVLILMFENIKEGDIALLPKDFVTELRSSISNIRMAAEHIIAQTESQEYSDLQKYVKMFYHNYYNTARLTDNLAALGEIAGGTMSFRPKMCDVVKLCAELIQSVAVLTSDKGINISFSSRNDAVYATVDELRLEQLILNLLSNSLRHTKRGDKIAVSLASSGSSFILSCDDTGAGVSDEAFSQAFASHRGIPTVSEIADGCGFGLNIAKGIAELHHGTLIIESRPSEGTSVRVSIPITADADLRFRSIETSYRVSGMDNILKELSGVLDYEYFGPELMD